MTLRNILPDRRVDIMVRTNLPPAFHGGDTLFGYCRWHGNSLESLDGDSYDIDWEITKFEWESENSLVVWIESEWW